MFVPVPIVLFVYRVSCSSNLPFHRILHDDASYIELHTPLMGHGVVGVVEVDVSLFSPQCELALSQRNLCIRSSLFQQVLYEFFAEIIFLFIHCH